MTKGSKYLGKKIELVIDRPIGSKHPEYGFAYEVNYGYVPGTKAPDGEEIDAYYIGEDKLLESAQGKCVAVIKRKDDDDEVDYHYYEGTWQTVEEDGVYKMYRSNIKEVENPSFDWFYTDES